MRSPRVLISRMVETTLLRLDATPDAYRICQRANRHPTFRGNEAMSVLGPKGKDLSIFVRFGGLNLKRQRGYSQTQTGFHKPPAPRGFYAFPKVAFEIFLIGSIETYQPSNFPSVEKQEALDWQSFSNEASKEFAEWRARKAAYDRQRRRAFSLVRKEFRKSHGAVWSHLMETVRRHEIIAAHGEWVKTTMREWRRAFSKQSLRQRMNTEISPGVRGVRSVNDAGGGIFGDHGRDHFEVFFDEKV